MNLCIYMATHKKQDKYDKHIITPIQVGSSLANDDLYELKDNTGNNISDKNKVYCELTALYWIWKNSEYDYVGLCHYRRFFEIKEKQILFSELQSGKIILPHLAHLGRSVEKQFNLEHPGEIWNIMLYVLKEKYPNDYLLSKTVFSDNKMIPFNMFIAKKEIIDKYCEWLFSILFEVEKRVDESKLDDYQLRYGGFLSERMFILYVRANNIPFTELKIVDEYNNRVSKSEIGKILNNGHFVKEKILRKNKL